MVLGLPLIGFKADAAAVLVSAEPGSALSNVAGALSAWPRYFSTPDVIVVLRVRWSSRGD